MSATPEAAINTVTIFKAVIRSVSAFGIWGWVDLIGASILLFGCGGELWLLLNKLPEHNERRVSLKGFWAYLDCVESVIRQIGVRLKIIRPRKFSDLKEHLLEGFFISLVAIGVGMEVFSLPFSLKESADANFEAKNAENDAGQANLQVGVLSNETIRLSINLEESKSNNLQLTRQVFGLTTQIDEINVNIAQVREMASSPDVTEKLNEAKASLADAKKTIADVKNILENSNLAPLKVESPDRQITPEQSEILLTTLRTYLQTIPLAEKRTVQIESSMNDSEATEYARQIENIFKKAGFETDRMQVLWTFNDEPPIGLEIFSGATSSEYHPPKILSATVMAFRAAKIKVETVGLYTNVPPDGSVHINVWRKPNK